MGRRSPTSRTFEWLTENGYDYFDVVERYIPRARKSLDLFGVFDLVAIAADGSSIIGIQVCGMGGAHAARKKKITASSAAAAWCRAGGLILLISWRKVRARGRAGGRMVYRPRVEWIEL